MSDDMQVTGVTTAGEPAASSGAAQPKTAKSGFLGSTVGKIVLIGGGLAVILAIVAVVVVLVLGTFSASPGGSGTPAPIVPAQTGSKVESESVLPTSPPVVPAIQTRDVFTPRDPFEIVLAPEVPTETVTADANILVLKDIVTEDGVRKGVFTYNGVEYTAGPGEQLGETSWKVLAVGTSSADVLFGDDRISLSLGQGIQK